MTILWFTLLCVLVQTLDAPVGQAEGSGHPAVMALLGVPPAAMTPTAAAGARHATARAFRCATMVIKVSGRGVPGFFLVLISERCIVHPNWRLFFAIGFLRSYTTCSTFSFETFGLIERRSSLMALVNTVGSVRLGQLAVMTGMLLARMP